MLYFLCFICIVIKLITFKIVHSRACDVPCPQHKSFCSDVGCVSDCPAPFYVNGTHCVMSCGNLLVDQNRNCIENCPVGTYIKETLQFADSKQYLEKTCVQCGVDVGFILNSECVKACPEKWKYVLEENLARCLQECPFEKPYTNYVNISGVLHGECVATCSAFVNDGVCVASCSDGRIGFGNICVDVCPVSSPYIHNGNCHKECPQMTFLNKTNILSCVTVCPNERPYILYNICVENCPKQFSYIKESKGFKYCVENCQENEKLSPENNTCVDACPLLKVTFKNTCIDHCPQESMLSCRTRKGQPCGNDPVSEEAHAVCVQFCPSNMFRWKNSCVYACPDGVPMFERECTENCPIDRPYKIKRYDANSFYRDYYCFNVQQRFECTRECPSDDFLYNGSCLSYCPYPLLQYESFCVSKCPDSAPLQVNSTIQVMVCNETNFRKETRTENVVKCVSSCGPSHVQFKSTCTEKCPETSQFVHNSTCQQDHCTSMYVEFTKFGIVCNDSCRGYILEYNNTCYRKCPQSFKVLNGTCVEKCPDSHIYIAESTYSDCSERCSQDDLRQECLKVCPNETFVNKNNCVQICEPPLKSFKNECLPTCPDSAPYINVSSARIYEMQYVSDFLRKSFVDKQVIYCVSDCPGNKAYNNGTCTESCPSHSRYITNRTCSNKTCNTKQTYLVNPLGIICADQCPYNMFELNQTCVQQCPNNYKLYNSTCLPSCPKSNRFVSEEPLPTDLYNCSDTVCSNILRQICKKECSSDQYIEEEKCLLQCTDGRYIFQHTCYEKCPSTHPFIQPVFNNYYKEWQLDWKNIYWYRDSYSSNRLHCVSKCSEGYHQFGNSTSCVQLCTDPLPLSFNGRCVKECPSNALLDISDGKCVEKCPEDTAKYNNSCHRYCPDNQKIFNFQCVSECPSSAPFEMKNDRHVCRKSCGRDKLFKDGDCIDSFKCTDPLFDFADACIESCPEGFVWFATCNSLRAVYLAIVILPLISLSVLVGCSRKFLCDIGNVLKLGFASQAQLYSIQWEMYNERMLNYRSNAHMLETIYEDNLQNPESSEETEALLEQNDDDSYTEVETLCL